MINLFRVINTSVKSNKIEKFRLIYGILAGLFISFIFYAFLYVGREFFRYLSITEDYDLWILSDNEVGFYNLIMAFIAVIAGQSTFFAILFSRPGELFERKHYLNVTVVNDQRFLNISFLYWLLNISLVIALFFGTFTKGGFYVLNLYPKYNYIFVLLVIVLFSQSWVSIRRKFGKRSVKWMLISALFLSLFALLLSRINFIDYKSINEICLRKNIIYTNNINLPQVDYTEKEYNFYEEKRIYIVEGDPEPYIILNNEKINLEMLPENISICKEDIDPSFQNYKLYISKNQNIQFVNKVKKELSKAGIRRISYAVLPEDMQYDKRYYHDEIIKLNIPYISEENFSDYYKGALLFENIMKIETVGEENFSLNNNLLQEEAFQAQIKQSLKENSDYIYIYIINNSNNFSDYIKTISLLKKVINELREEYSINEYKTEFKYLNEVRTNEVIEIYPFRLMEITYDMTILLNN